MRVKAPGNVWGSIAGGLAGAALGLMICFGLSVVSLLIAMNFDSLKPVFFPLMYISIDLSPLLVPVGITLGIVWGGGQR